MRGKDHIKRAMVQEEERKERGEGWEDGRQGYKVGPREMAKVTSTITMPTTTLDTLTTTTIFTSWSRRRGRSWRSSGRP